MKDVDKERRKIVEDGERRVEAGERGWRREWSDGEMKG